MDDQLDANEQKIAVPARFYIMCVFVIKMYSTPANSPFDMEFLLQQIFDDVIARLSPKEPFG